MALSSRKRPRDAQASAPTATPSALLDVLAGDALHHVLSFLPSKDAMEFAATARRFHATWLVPHTWTHRLQDRWDVTSESWPLVQQCRPPSLKLFGPWHHDTRYIPPRPTWTVTDVVCDGIKTFRELQWVFDVEGVSMEDCQEHDKHLPFPLWKIRDLFVGWESRCRDEDVIPPPGETLRLQRITWDWGIHCSLMGHAPPSHCEIPAWLRRIPHVTLLGADVGSFPRLQDPSEERIQTLVLRGGMIRRRASPFHGIPHIELENTVCQNNYQFPETLTLVVRLLPYESGIWPGDSGGMGFSRETNLSCLQSLEVDHQTMWCFDEFYFPTTLHTLVLRHATLRGPNGVHWALLKSLTRLVLDHVSWMDVFYRQSLTPTTLPPEAREALASVPHVEWIG